jgi:hypothetical protein
MIGEMLTGISFGVTGIAIVAAFCRNYRLQDGKHSPARGQFFLAAHFISLTAAGHQNASSGMDEQASQRNGREMDSRSRNCTPTARQHPIVFGNAPKSSSCGQLL